MKINLIVILLILISLPNYSQIISGTVLDYKTGKQIPYVNVYFNGTTLGTNTDKLGSFNLILPKQGKFPIVFSAIGYESIFLSDYPTGRSLMVLMEPKIYELEEVIVRSKKSLFYRANRNYYLIMFKKQFLGESLNASKCRILNQDDIVLEYLYDKDLLKAYSNKPLIIENKALGYQIIYFIDKFEYSSLWNILNLYGYFNFKEDTALGGQQKVNADKRRRLAYLGSRMHLFRSLWENNLDSTGYTLKNTDNKKLTYDSLVVQTDSDTKFLNRKGIIDLAYLSKRSDTRIEILQDSVYFNQSGYFAPYVINWAGKMSDQRVADMLPFDYVYK